MTSNSPNSNLTGPRDSQADPASSQDHSASSQDQQYSEFVALLARNDQSLRRLIRSLMPSSESIDDVMQDTALECWRKFSDFSPADPANASTEFVRWACVIARFKVLSRKRDYARDRLVFRDDVVEKIAASAMEGLDRQDVERASIERCLGKLDQHQRRLVLSVHVPGDSIAKIAEETGHQARRLYSEINVLRKKLLDCVNHAMVEEGS